MAIEQNLTMFIGEDKTLTVAIQKADGSVQPIDDWSLSWMVKKRAADANDDAVIVKQSFDSPDGITITDPTAGLCTIGIVDTDTDPLQPRIYHHELKRMDEGAETVLIYGTLDLVRGVHRA